MDDGALLLRAILENPDDDTPRLVYADWLDERGEADRAAWIREMIHTSEVRRDMNVGAACIVTSGVADSHGLLGCGTATITRGFVSEIDLPPDRFMTSAAAVFASQPVTAVLLEATAYHNGAGYSWFKHSRTRQSPLVPDAARVPDEVYELLQGWTVWTPSGNKLSGVRWKAYETQQLARDALSDACVSLGRSLAGLSSLAQQPLERQ